MSERMTVDQEDLMIRRHLTAARNLATALDRIAEREECVAITDVLSTLKSLGIVLILDPKNGRIVEEAEAVYFDNPKRWDR
jgi:hypothetical protein